MNKLTEVRDDVVVAFRRRRRGPQALVCAWRVDPTSGELFCVWSAPTGGRKSTAAVPLQRAS